MRPSRPSTTSIRRQLLTAATVAALTAGSGASYVVRSGDTLTGIARSQGTSVSALAEANGLRDPDFIRAGQTLRLPRTSTSTGSSSSVGSAPARSVERAEVGRLIERVAREHGWSPAFVKALAWQESGWRNDRVSPAGAVGIMQVMPETGRFVSRRLVGRELDLTDPEDNVVAGVAFLQHVWTLTGGDARMTLAGYYQGLASVQRHGMSADTDRYVANVLALRERFR